MASTSALAAGLVDHYMVFCLIFRGLGGVANLILIIRFSGVGIVPLVKFNV